MKKLFLVVMLCSAFLLMGTTASAINFLQLDIVGGSYDSGPETTIGGPTGTLIALLDPTKNFWATDNKYFITLSIQPKTTSYGGNLTLSNFDFRTTDPGGALLGGGGISYSGTTAPYPQVNHGEAFPSNYWTFGGFTIDGSKTVSAYNTQDPTDTGNYDLYAAYFTYDFSGIIGQGGVEGIHFDLYAENDDGEFVKMAPFSHDASAVPEPTTMLLLGAGLMGLAGFGRKRFKK